MYQCALQTYRFSRLFVVLIVISITCQEPIPYSQFLRLRRLCCDDSDFSRKLEEMCQFFEKRDYHVFVVKAGHHRAQQFGRQSALGYE